MMPVTRPALFLRVLHGSLRVQAPSHPSKNVRRCAAIWTELY